MVNVLDSGISIDKFDITRITKDHFSAKQRRFFESKKGLSSNASRDKTHAFDRLAISIRIISYLLQNSHNLRIRDLETMFTAQTLQYFFENLLKNYKDYKIKNYKHDFRTTELARLMFETAAEYLRDATDTETVYHDLKRVSDHFKTQSESEMRNESYSMHGNELERELTQKHETDLLEKRQQLEEKLHSLGENPDVQHLEKEYDELSHKLIILKHNMENEKSKSKVHQLKNNILKYKKKKTEIYQKLSGMEDSVILEIHKIDQKLERKLNHLKPFYCRKKFLSPFTFDIIDEKMAIPDPDDDTGLVISSAENGYNSFFMPENRFPKDGIITDQMRKFYTSTDYHLSVIDNHEKVKWLVNEPGSDLKKIKQLRCIKNRKLKPIFGITPTLFGDED